jgi:N-acyl-D-amino-acid deacylase
MRLLIKNGKIIDGSGSPAKKLNILIKDGKIIKIAPEIESSSSKIIDAGGRYVSPGFIDIHNHADLTILEENKAEAYVKQGITTILAGVCGIGVYPANNNVKKYYYNFVNKAFCASPRLMKT